jgi:glycosyltransferase involved in cell wall biosynthesis
LRVVYTGSFGVGRPLADILDALVRAPSAVLTLYALHVTSELVRSEALARGVEDRVVVLPPLAPDELRERLGDYDVGIVFDRPLTRNAELSLPNKLFEYLAAGLAVAVPRLPAMTPVVEETGAGVTYAPGDPADLGGALEALAANRGELAAMRASALRAAKERFNSRRQREVLRRAWQA